MRDTSNWYEHAACAGRPTHWWFPADDGRTPTQLRADTDKALAICNTCPVQAPCAATGRREPLGIWGGRSPAAEAHAIAVRQRPGKRLYGVPLPRDNRRAAQVLRIDPQRVAR